MDRRQLITRLPLAGAAMALTAAPATVTAKPAENPELIRLGVELDSAILIYAIAKQQKQTARARYDALAPERPGDLYANGCGWDCIAEMESDIEGNSVWPEKGPARRYIPTYWLEDRAKLEGRRTKYGRALHRLRDLARRYDAGVALAASASRIGEAKEVEWAASSDLRAVVEKVVKAKARTPDGIVLQARAIIAARELDEERGGIHWALPTLVDNIVAVLGGVAS